MQEFDSQALQVIDLNFHGLAGAIGVFLIPLGTRAALIESGPASTFPALEAGINAAGYELADISDLLLSHIHLDHAGAAGLLARHGARVHVHPRGAPHLVNPQRLLYSAERIYGEHMERLWGKTVPVPEDQIDVRHDQEQVRLGPYLVRVLETPGHASHHHSYLIDEVCFTGDVGAVRLSGTSYVELPLPPPDINLEHWLASIEYISRYPVSVIAPTHFGIFSDAGEHLARVQASLQQVSAWVRRTMQDQPDESALRERVTAWFDRERKAHGLSGLALERIEAANPAWMAAAGIHRYWKLMGGEGPQPSGTVSQN